MSILRKVKIAGLSVTCLVLIVGCSDPKKPSKSNFQTAIQAALDTQPLCVNLPTDKFPFEIGKDEKLLSFTGNRKAQLDALTEAKLLTATDARVMTKPMFGQPKEVDGLRYDFTKEGSALAQASTQQGRENPHPRFCYGKLKVEEVIRFTEPSDIAGMTISQVVYKQAVTDVAPWAKTLSIQSAWPEIKKALENTDNETDTLILTSEGWVHERMMKK